MRLRSILLNLSSYFPVEETIQVVQHEVLVILNHGIRLRDAEVHPSLVNQFLTLLCFLLGVGVLRSARQQEVLLKALDGFFDNFLLIVQQTQFQEGISLSRLVSLLVGNVEQLLQMLDGLLHVLVLGVRLGELSVGLGLLLRHVFLLGDFEELPEEVDGAHQIALPFVNVTNFLITLSLLLSVFGCLGGLKTLLEELKSLDEIVLFLLLHSNGGVHPHEMGTDFLLELCVLRALRGLVQGRYQIIHGVVYVHDLLLADAATHVGLGYSLVILVLYADVQALLVEIGSRLEIVQVLKLHRHLSVLLQASIDVLNSQLVLGIHEVVAEFLKTLLSLLKLLLLNFT